MAIIHAYAATLMNNLMRENKNSQVDIYEGLTQRSKQTGTDCSAIPSIAGHFCINTLKPRTLFHRKHTLLRSERG